MLLSLQTVIISSIFCVAQVISKKFLNNPVQKITFQWQKEWFCFVVY